MKHNPAGNEIGSRRSINSAVLQIDCTLAPSGIFSKHLPRPAHPDLTAPRPRQGIPPPSDSRLFLSFLRGVHGYGFICWFSPMPPQKASPHAPHAPRRRTMQLLLASTFLSITRRSSRAALRMWGCWPCPQVLQMMAPPAIMSGTFPWLSTHQHRSWTASNSALVGETCTPIVRKYVSARDAPGSLCHSLSPVHQVPFVSRSPYQQHLRSLKPLLLEPRAVTQTR